MTLGESHVAGCTRSENRRWVNICTHRRVPGCAVTLHNRGISANAISPRSPGYAASAAQCPERYQRDVIALADLFILSYRLNACRMSLADFRADMGRIIADVAAACHPVTVLTTVYYMTAYDLYPPFNVGSIAATEAYNLALGELAEQHGCLLADIWAAEGQADWVIHPDTVHANDLGHRLIALRRRSPRTAARGCGRDGKPRR